MAKDITNFQKDLDNPEAGTKSDLYSVIKPMIDTEDATKLRGHDATRIEGLRKQVREGLVGLEYLTGLKKNKAKTFYDEHPVQAVGTDILKHSPMIGAGIAVGGTALNYRNQYKNMMDTERGHMSRKEDPHGENPTRKLYPEKGKPVDEDTLRLFGGSDVNDPQSFEKRLHRLDQAGKSHNWRKQYQGLGTAHSGRVSLLNDQLSTVRANINAAQGGNTRALKQEESEIMKALSEAEKSHQGNLRGLLEKSRGSKESKLLNDYVGLHETLLKHKESGKKFKPYIGEGLHSVKSKNPAFNKFREHLAPSKNQAIEDLVYKRILQRDPSAYREHILKDIISDTEGYDFAKKNTSTSKGRETEEVRRSMLRSLRNPQRQHSTLGKIKARAGMPMAIGAATAAGGTGLYHLVKAMQNNLYAKDRVKDWKKNTLKYRGEFEEADRVK